ncbi:sialate O-acetylesterase [Anditalea andensis]|uniref:9-O-acetylesterase n=1 Tax=Anditalea andensis TaxID=1048983 RepID=A0A074LKC8_9BACT|nr:sialate O-acetylesterase [Anditalea andensis]KEO74277.1 9-O-acetylesterase [Anditalea andensis]
MNRFYIFILLAFTASIQNALGEITLPAIFSDNMVLQRNMDAPMWGWGSPNGEVQIKPSWSSEVYHAKINGEGQWRITLPTPDAGGPYQIRLNDGDEISLNNILIGDIWLCSGQSNMEMPLKGFPGQPVEGGNEAIVTSRNPSIRLLTVPRKSRINPENDFEGGWKMAEPSSVGNFSATAWFFGQLLHQVLDVPIGLLHVSYGGSNIEAWMNSEMLKDFPEIVLPERQEQIKELSRTPTVLYNGMLAPVIGFGIKGAIWYQGESNYDRPDQYEDLQIAMVREWRKVWGQGGFPFYYTQISPFDYSQFTPDKKIEKNNSAYIRDAQRKVLDRIPKSGMAVLMDLGEDNNIHPKRKKEVGHRLAYMALSHTYDITGFESFSPEYSGMEINENLVTVSFNHVPNGITSFGKEVTGFEISGENRKFYPAKAVLRNKSLVLSSPDVPKPVAIRYAFKDFVVGELFSTGGLPLSSFRSDDW